MNVTINLTSGNKGALSFPSLLDEENLALLVTTNQIFRQLHKKPCDYWLIINLSHSRKGLKVFPLRLFSSTKLLRKISNYSCNFTVLSSFSDIKKQVPNTDLQTCCQFIVSIEIALDLKVCFCLVTYTINNVIAFRSTNQHTKISTLDGESI